MNSKIVFGNDNLLDEFEKLKIVDKKLYKQLVKAFETLEKDAFSGIHIPKHLIPKEYSKKNGKLSNLWKYNLPNAWRLIYTIRNADPVILSVILEWLDHKNYERRFGY